jgi:hypothetical protein
LLENRLAWCAAHKTVRCASPGRSLSNPAGRGAVRRECEWCTKARLLTAAVITRARLRLQRSQPRNVPDVPRARSHRTACSIVAWYFQASRRANNCLSGRGQSWIGVRRIAVVDQSGTAKPLPPGVGTRSGKIWLDQGVDTYCQTPERTEKRKAREAWSGCSAPDAAVLAH